MKPNDQNNKNLKKLRNYFI